MLLISDLHLEAEREDITASFLHFLTQRASAADRLYILGDLFEVWVGDDQDSLLATRVAEALKTLHRRGTEIQIMHGNRDFLIGPEFAQRCGAKLIPDPYLITQGGQRIALMHGDILCTADRDYLQFRAMVREPSWQQEFLDRPLSERLAIARDLRTRSMASNRNKTQEIMDVTPEEVVRRMTQLSVNILIHGHTHRPARHSLVLADGSPAQRMVLGDWHSQGWFAEVGANGDVTLECFPLQTGAN